MKVLNKISLTAGIATCAHIGPRDRNLMQQFFEERTSIWTCRYPEKKNEHGLEVDTWDALSSYLVLVMDDVVVGGCRLIHGNEGDPLPVASCSERSIKGEAVEVSRFFLSLEKVPGVSRDECGALLAGLVGGIESYLTHEGFTCAYATIRESLFLKLERMGIPMVRIGQNQEHSGKQFIPAKMLVRHAEHALQRMYKASRSPVREMAPVLTLAFAA